MTAYQTGQFMTLSRREALALTAASSILSACSSRTSQPTPSTSQVQVMGHTTPPATPTSPTTQAVATFSKAPIPTRPIESIPATGRQIALTIDDGVRPDVVEGYAELCRRTSMRLTFFANGCYDSWKMNRKILAPLVESGQIVIANHTYDHPDIRMLSHRGLSEQITQNEKVFRDLFGINLAPFFRPPYGYYNSRTVEQLHDMGYNGITMWYGTTGDEQNISASRIMANLNTYAQPGRIIIGHANHPGVLSDFDAIDQLFRSRNLRPVTIADVYI